MKHAWFSVSNFRQLQAFNGNQYCRGNDFIATLVVDGFFPYIGNLVQNGVLLCIFDVSLMESITQRADFEISFSLPVPRSVLREQFEGGIEPDEAVMPEFEEGFDRADFRSEFSPSPNLEGPQPPPRDNVSRNFPTVSSSPPRARTNNDGEFYLALCFFLLSKISACDITLNSTACIICMYIYIYIYIYIYLYIYFFFFF